MNYFQKPCSPLIAPLIELLLPQTCALCKSLTGSASSLCTSCSDRLPRLGNAHCPRCADFSAAAALCGHCLTDPPVFDGVIAPFLYADPIDRLIQALKYGHQLRLARWLGESMLKSLPHSLSEDPDLIIPLPLHPNRLRERGFNQAVEIARPISQTLGKPLALDAVARTRATTPQADLPRDQRQRNVKNAFECRIDLHQKSVLLIDDVMTTGSSVGELSRILKLYGARKVMVAVAARTHHAHS